MGKGITNQALRVEGGRKLGLMEGQFAPDRTGRAPRKSWERKPGKTSVGKRGVETLNKRDARHDVRRTDH